MAGGPGVVAGEAGCYGPPPMSVVPSAEQRAARATALSIAPGVLLTGVGGGIAFPILPLVGMRAGLPLAFIGVILAANRFSRVFAGVLLVGAAVDRLGARRVLIVGLGTQAFVLALYWAGVVTGHPGVFFLLGRLLHGPSRSVRLRRPDARAPRGRQGPQGARPRIVRSALSAGMPVGLICGGLLAGWIGPPSTFGAARIAVGRAGRAPRP